MMSETNPLLEPFQLGDLTLPNRVIMAPLTRNRANDYNAPTEMNAKYYGQRAAAGLIVTEATQVDPMGQGYPRTPGIHSEKQVEGWKLVTNAVHEQGGRIFLQLWHVGRISHSDYHDGKKPVAPSPVKPAGEVFKPNFETEPFETPRALETQEIPDVVDQFGRGAELAKEAGFDGVELHAANGYLIDQFLRTGTNQRNDRYGGSTKNRVRFLREVTKAVLDVWSPNRVGVRLSPLSDFNDMSDENPEETFTQAAGAVEELSLGYLHLVEPVDPKPPIAGNGTVQSIFASIRDAYEGALIANGNYTPEPARDAIETGYAELISFGRAFLSTPDLPKRIRENLPINVPDDETFYAGNQEGYTDYPKWEEIESGNQQHQTMAFEDLGPI